MAQLSNVYKQKPQPSFYTYIHIKFSCETHMMTIAIFHHVSQLFLFYLSQIVLKKAKTKKNKNNKTLQQIIK